MEIVGLRHMRVVPNFVFDRTREVHELVRAAQESDIVKSIPVKVLFAGKTIPAIVEYNPKTDILTVDGTF